MTDWYPANTTPARPGVYQRSRVLPGGTRTNPMYALFSGGVWRLGCSDADDAAAQKDISIWLRGLEWRGLSEDPDNE